MAAGPSVNLSLSNLDFGNQPVGTTSAPQPVTLTNDGTADVTFSGIGVSGDYSVASTCGLSLAPSASCNLNVTFTPTALGTRRGTISIADDAPGSPQVVTLAGTGTNSGNSAATVWGRDTWLTAGTSRVFRVVGTEDLVSAGITPTVTVSPGPITVNYVSVGNPRDLTVSITVPSGTPSGYQDLQITSGSLTHTITNGLQIVDSTLANPSPSVVSLGASATVSIAPNPLFSGQSSFSLDLGPDVSVGPLTLQPDGSLQAPVSVLPTALPGTRSVQLTAGPYAFIANRGFAVDFGPIVNLVPFSSAHPGLFSSDQLLPNGYTASVFALHTTANGLDHPDEMYVDETNTLYVLNVGTPYGGSPFSISVFDLNPDNFGAVKGVLQNIDASGRGGLLESGTMLPSLPGKLLISTEDEPPSFPGGRTITAVDTATGASSLFWYNPDWNLDPIKTDVTGNLVGFAGVDHSPQWANIFQMDPNANVLKLCPINNFADQITLDPLSGNFFVSNYGGGAYTLDITDCTTAPRTDGPNFDGGSFAPAAGNFGNQYFTADAVTWHRIWTLVPVPYTDPDQSVPERAVLFAYGLSADGVWFDRDAQNLIFTDVGDNALISISRDPTYQPPVPAVSLSPASLFFGTTDVGTPSPPQTVTLLNTGQAPLSIAGIAATGDFSQTNNCGNSLPAGAGCTISVTFAPTAAGARTGALAVIDTASGSPQTVALSGTGRGFSLSTSPTSSTITAGQTATYTLSVAPAGGFNQTVSLACSGAPSLATCSISPGSVTPDGTNPVTATVTVTTTARAMVYRPHAGSPEMGRHRGLPVLVWLMALAMLAGLAAVAAVPGPRRDVPLERLIFLRRLTGPSLLSATLLMALSWAACGGGGGGDPGTPPGIYTLTVTATHGALSHSTTVTLKVN
jgi:hypothetical protein